MSTPNNLPADLTSFVGREAQLAELRRLIHRSRLVTLTGPGGAGKTRLALRLCRREMDRFPGGVWLVELGALADPSLLESAVADACGARDEGGGASLEALAKRLSARPTLLLLDGCERLAGDVGALAGQLLGQCPDLTIVTATRQALGESGEVTWRTPGLTEAEAVRLFVERATAVQPGFNPAPPAGAPLAELVHRLEGLPLAIELAAGLVGTFTVPEISARLRGGLDLVLGPHEPALRRALVSSHELLSDAEKALFGRLAVFFGFDLDAVAAMSEIPSRFASLERLVAKSLVVSSPIAQSRTRFRMLDPIREVALASLTAEAHAEASRHHANYFFELAKAAAAKLRDGDQSFWLQRVEMEEANIQLAFAWLEANAPDRFQLMTGFVSRYWYTRGKVGDGIAWLDRALAVASGEPSTRMSALQARARLHRHRGDRDEAARDAQECAVLARRLGDVRNLIGALTTLGTLSSSAAEWHAATDHYAEALALARRLGDPVGIASELNNLALVESAGGDQETARRHVEEALEHARRSGDRILTASIEETAGRIDRRRGEHVQARARYMGALATAAEFEDVANLSDILDGLAVLATFDGDPEHALTLAGAASRMRSESRTQPPAWDQREVHDSLAAARSAIGQRRARAAWERGAGMSIAAVTELAGRKPTEGRLRHEPTLSRRELEIAALVSEGLTNQEIAHRLRIALRTVDAHIEHIRNKVGLRTRAQIAVWAHDRLLSAG